MSLFGRTGNLNIQIPAWNSRRTSRNSAQLEIGSKTNLSIYVREIQKKWHLSDFKNFAGTKFRPFEEPKFQISRLSVHFPSSYSNLKQCWNFFVTLYFCIHPGPYRLCLIARIVFVLICPINGKKRLSWNSTLPITNEVHWWSSNGKPPSTTRLGRNRWLSLFSVRSGELSWINKGKVRIDWRWSRRYWPSLARLIKALSELCTSDIERWKLDY